MVLPILPVIAAAATAAAAGTGVYKSHRAGAINAEAEELFLRAKRQYMTQLRQTDRSKQHCNSILNQYGQQKLRILSNQIYRFVLNLFFEQQRNKTLVILQNRLALSRDDAEDIYQEACIALYQNIQSGKLVELTSSLSTYFTSICMNKGKKLLDRRPDNISFEGAVENTEGDEYSATQIETILGLGDGITAEQRAAMRDIVQDLPSPCEEILWSY